MTIFKDKKSLFLYILFIKLIIFMYILNYTNIGGSDANQYHDYIIGNISHSYNIWPKILYKLNQYGLYNREVIKYILFIVSSIIVPLMIVKTIQMNYKLSDNDIYWNIAIVISLYPAIFLLSIDIYRDIIMIFLFLLIVYFFKIYTITVDRNLYIYLLIVISVSFFLYFWRPYLGFSLLIAAFTYKLLIFKIVNIKFILMFYILGLLFLYTLGYLEPLLVYRGEGGFKSGNTTLGIGLLDKNPLEFLLLFMYSGIMQLFGFYVMNFSSLLMFLVESIPFIFGCYYVFINRKYLGDFERFILQFSLIYATIWVLGNDNLGTAIRLRTYNYLSIFIVATSIYIIKKYVLKGNIK